MENSLSPASITHNLTTHFIGKKVIYYPQLTSTMRVAKREARQGTAEGTVVIAGEQTAGKGRIKRTWLSPKGSIALSIILYPDAVYLPYLIMLASLAVIHSIKTSTNLKSRVKWPNDILLNGKKVCGILIENEVRGNVIDHAVIGIGINANLKLADFPEISPLATSLSDELGRAVSRLDIISLLLAEVEKLYTAVLSGESIYEEWRDSLVTLGRRVQVKSGKTGYHEGIAESVSKDGSLLLRQPDGSLTKIVAGDVTILK